MSDDRRWAAALAEHERVVRQFRELCAGIALSDWHRSPAPRKWSPAAEVLHVCRAYEVGRDAAAGGPSMRLLVTPRVAWFSRMIVLPLIFATDLFPRGARAPAEVVPDDAEAQLLLPDAAVARLDQVAQQAAAALHKADGRRPVPRITHAYFGDITPRTSLRLLSAHTKHHARRMARPVAASRRG